MKFRQYLILLLLTGASGYLGYVTRPRVSPILANTEGHLVEQVVSPQERLAAILQQPDGTESDEDLRKLSEQLTPTDPESAARALMLCDEMPRWRDLLERLCQEDPAALPRLAAEATELRFLNDLRAYHLKAQYSADPEGLLEKASAIQNTTRFSLNQWAVEAIAKENPTRAIEVAQGLSPGFHKAVIVNRALTAAMAEDPQATLRWISSNIDDLHTMQVQLAFRDYQKSQPQQIKEVILAAPPEQQRALIETAMVCSEEPAEAQLEFLRSLPSNLRDAGLRAIFLVSMQAEILPKLSPEERPIGVEMTTFWTPEQDQAAWLNTLQSPEDKAAAARVIPHLMFATEEQKAALLQRLQP